MEVAQQPSKEPQLQDWARWTNARFIAQSRLPQAASLIPIIGYAILWSSQFESLISKHHLPAAFVPVQWKLQCLWWGAVAMSLGLGIYIWKCPRVIKRATDPEDYVLQQFQAPNPLLLVEAAKLALEISKNYHPMEAKKLIRGEMAPQDVRMAAEVLSNINEATPAFVRHTPYVHIVLQLQFHHQNHALQFWRRICFVMLAGGAFTFLIPAIDTTVQVARRFLSLAGLNG